MVIFIAIIFFVFFVSAFWKGALRSGKELVPSDFFLVSGIIAWSPATFWSVEQTHLPGLMLSESGIVKFTIAYGTFLFFLSASFLLSKRFFSYRHRSQFFQLPPSTRRLAWGAAVGVATLLMLVYVAVPIHRAFLRDLYDVLLGMNWLSYGELRREVYANSPFHALVHARLQYSFVALVGALIVVLCPRSWPGKIAALISYVAFIGICGTSLKKQAFIYYVILFIILLSYRFLKKGMRSVRTWVIAGATALLSVGSLFGLYLTQYRSNVYFGAREAWDALVFRVFRAYPDGMKLYMEVIPDVVPHTYGASISIFAPILGYTPRAPEGEIAQYFGLTTSFPAGAIGFAYADAGFIGVAFAGVLAALILQWLNQLYGRMAWIETRTIFFAVVGLATCWFWNSSLTSSLLTGGIGVGAMGCWMMDRLLSHTASSRRAIPRGPWFIERSSKF